MSRTFTYLFVNRLWLLFPKSIDFKDKNYIYLGITVIKINRAHKHWKFVKKNKVYYTPPGHCSGQNWLSPLPTNVTTLRLTAMLCKLGKRIWNLLKEKTKKIRCVSNIRHSCQADDTTTCRFHSLRFHEFGLIANNF